MGLFQAGFHVTGVDLVDQPHYPFRFIKGDALEVDLAGYDFIWASPPCQAHSSATRNRRAHVDRIPETRERLQRAGVPYVIENVLGAPLIDPILLCGAMFGLGVLRHRLFETSWFVLQPGHPDHCGTVTTGEYMTVTGNSSGVASRTMRRREELGLPRTLDSDRGVWRRRIAMGIDWMPGKALSQAIPPAFARFIGDLALKHLEKSA